MPRSRPLPVLLDHAGGPASAESTPSGGACATGIGNAGLASRNALRSALEAEGWTWRFAAASPRLEEMADLYRSLGHEVRLEPLGAGESIGAIDPVDDAGPTGAPLGPADCTGCDEARAAFRTIYTRRLK
jgi:hypothetical protein